jgi:hypothetical protein
MPHLNEYVFEDEYDFNFQEVSEDYAEEQYYNKLKIKKDQINKDE